MSDQYEKAEQKSGIGNRLGGIGNSFRSRAIAKAGSIGMKNLAMDTLTVTNLGATSYTTTDTTQWLFAFSIYINSYYPKWTEFAFGSMHVKHSAVNAVFGAAIYMYRDPTGAATGTYDNLMIVDNVQLPAQNAWFPVPIIGSNTWGGTGVILPIGKHYLAMGVRNYTTGTLTVIQPNDDFISAWGSPW